MIEKLTGLRIKFFQSDQGGEFMLEAFMEFLEEHGITQEMSAPRTPQQNGVAEQMNQTLLGGACAMVQHASMTKGFWAEAIRVATHILNHTPRKSLAWRTPYKCQDMIFLILYFSTNSTLPSVILPPFSSLTFPLTTFMTSRLTNNGGFIIWDAN